MWKDLSLYGTLIGQTAQQFKKICNAKLGISPSTPIISSKDSENEEKSLHGWGKDKKKKPKKK